MAERTAQEVVEEFIERELKRLAAMSPEEFKTNLEQGIKELKENQPHVWSQIGWMLDKEEYEAVLRELENDPD